MKHPNELNYKKYLIGIKKLIKISDKKKVVYSANFGSYDSINDPKLIDKDWDYIYFTDNPFAKSASWNIVLIDKIFANPRLTARLFKHAPHIFLENYETSLWMDSKIILDKDSPDRILEHQKKNNFLCFKHHTRDTVLKEAFACMKKGHESVTKILSQYIKYRIDGFKDDSHIIESAVLLRNHMNTQVIIFQENWLHEILTRTIRDQLSFNYVAWSCKLEYKLFNKDIFDMFTQADHIKYGLYDKDKFHIPIQRRIYTFLKKIKKK
jgi:hypothetical protein